MFICDLLIILLCIFLHLLKKNKLNISEFYRDSITFQTNIMYTPTNFDQTNCIRTTYYNSTSPNEYLSDSSSCTDNRSDLRSDNYNDYKSNYKSNNEEASCTSICSTIKCKKAKD